MTLTDTNSLWRGSTSVLAAGALLAMTGWLAGCEEQVADELPANGAQQQPLQHDHDHDHDHDNGHQHDHDHGHDHAHNGDEAAAYAGDPYPLDVCPVSGAPLGSMGEPAAYVHEGRHILFCCAGCDDDFEADPEQHIEQIDEQIIEQQGPHYPLDTCLVRGEPLEADEMVELVHNNRLVRVCCPRCAGAFEDDPDQYLAQLDEAVKEDQREDYPLAETCVVSDEPLDEWGEPVEIVVANRLVRLCCNHCARDFDAHPARYLSAIDAGEAVGDGGHH